MRSLLAVYGGTFDPVHLGHLGAMRDVVARTGCEHLIAIPAQLPPLRGVPQASADDRLRMLELACADEPRIEVDDRELRRPGPSYTVDTLESLRADLGDEIALAWVIGTDALARLDQWHRWQALPRLAHLLVLSRPGSVLPSAGEVARLIAERGVDDPQALRSAPAGCIWSVRQTPMDISASQVRDLIARGEPVNHLLPAPVWGYIKATGLYRQSGPVGRIDNAEIE